MEASSAMTTRTTRTTRTTPVRASRRAARRIARASGGASRRERGERGEDAGPLDFTLPPELEAGEPPEARGLARDEVRLMVSHLADDRVIHTRFRAIAELLRAGRCAGDQHQRDAQRGAARRRGRTARRWSCTSPRTCRRTCGRGGAAGPSGQGAARSPSATPRRGRRCALPGGARPRCTLPTGRIGRRRRTPAGHAALDRDAAAAGAAGMHYLERHGFPIRYGYVTRGLAGELLPDGLRHGAGQRRDALGGPRLHAGADHRGWWRGACRSRRCCCTRAWPAWRTTSRPTRSSIACRRRRRGW